MRALLFLVVAALTGCGNPTSSAPAATTRAAATDPPTRTAPTPNQSQIWFFCDGIDAPVVYLFANTSNQNQTRFIEYDKRSGATVRSLDLQLGEGDGAAGSIYTPLLQNGQDFGHVRQVNAGNFETPAAAYTTPYTSVQIGDRNVECRWLPRTRVAAFTRRRSFVIHEDADGDLIYTTFDFANAATQPIDQSDNGRSTAFSVEVRGGQESVRPDGSDFTFPARDGFSYHISLKNDGSGQLQVLRNGAQVQAEPLTAYIVGQASQD
ncbi:MAG: hypothetical protein JSS00_14710 [Proteobacteria bacterium]|nr:hypothetical protein [Pseudomonadota bacterium]